MRASANQAERARAPRLRSQPAGAQPGPGATRAGTHPARELPHGFTLIELLFVIAIIAMLLGLLLPSLAGAREAGRSAVCSSNQRQLAAAVLLYAGDHDDRAAPGASDFRANLSRWHGSRARTSDAFHPEGGTLTPYLGAGDSGADASRAIRVCPTFAGVLARLDGAGRGFERSAGGYGYNNAYLGAELAPVGAGLWSVRDDTTGARLAMFAEPDRAVAFSDAAFPDGAAPDRVIEYSFAEPRLHPQYGPGSIMDPSIHFRHGSGRAVVAWLDGHVDSRGMTFSWSSGLYDPPSGEVRIGWFGEEDGNALFDYDAGGR